MTIASYPQSQYSRQHLLHAKRAFRRTVAFLFVLTIFCGFGYGFAQYLRDSQGFQVRRIRVAGAENIPVESIIALSGITTADNLLLMDLGTIKSRLLSNPYIQSCEIRRFLPDIVEISLKERHAVAMVLVHNRMFVVADDGVVLEELPNSSQHVGVLITDLTELGLVEPGQQIENKELRAALDMLQAFSKTDLASTVTISEVSARHVNDIRLYCDELPFEIRWGRGDFEKQARRLDALWKHLNHTFDFTEYCDLRFGQDVACR